MLSFDCCELYVLESSEPHYKGGNEIDIVSKLYCFLLTFTREVNNDPNFDL